ncbi:MAG: twin-arginine translocase TatA/TatE family subunit [Bacteroidales bacterium]|nr:twin-arginine translocase TatA/TatE family subunit [Bacteroidales bacterium]
MPVLLFLDISFGEIFIVITVIFIIFGPQKIPELARKFGKGLREIKKASSEVQREINREVSNFKTDVDMERMVNESDPKPGNKNSEGPEKDKKEIEEAG